MLLPALAASVLAANPYLDEGAALFDRMLYERAVPKLKRATEVSASTAAERRRAHDLLARTYAALGQNEEASRTFVALLSVDARAPLPADASPTIRRLFLEAKERLYPRGRAQLRRVAAPPPRVTVELVDPWELVARVELRQSAGEGALEPVVLEPGALLSGEVVPQATSCSVVALAASGEPVASLGPITLSGALTPLEPAGATAAPVLTVEEGAPAARPARWPVVVTAAASVALLAAGVALTAAAAGDSSSAAQQRFGADVRRLDDAARDKGIAGAVLLGAAVVGGAATAVIFFAW
ncbi:MAG: hypothetical protein IPJ65_23540 [Archangiaceae bacterium]|nr:hypothetical protein [Archangiaceae bacterium]